MKEIQYFKDEIQSDDIGRLFFKPLGKKRVYLCEDCFEPTMRTRIAKYCRHCDLKYRDVITKHYLNRVKKIPRTFNHYKGERPDV
jgi:hypothetical protein